MCIVVLTVSLTTLCTTYSASIVCSPGRATNFELNRRYGFISASEFIHSASQLLAVFQLNFNEIQLEHLVVSYSYHNILEISYRNIENLISPNPSSWSKLVVLLFL